MWGDMEILLKIARKKYGVSNPLTLQISSIVLCFVVNLNPREDL